MFSEVNRKKPQRSQVMLSRRERLAQGIRWVWRGGLAVLDQALFSGANFLVNLLLARWLPPGEYGAFAVAYSIFLLLAGFHTAILTEPMLVFGAGRYRHKFSEYLGILFYGHWGVTGSIALLLAFIALGLRLSGSRSLAMAMTGLALGSPAILLLWLVRRAFYVHLLPEMAALGGGVYLVLMTAGFFLLQRLGHLAPLWAFGSMGVASLLVALLFIRMLRPQWRFRARNLAPRIILDTHWDYGRWSTATALLVWVSADIYYLVLPAWAGLEGSGALRALMNFVMPILHVNSALSAVLIPYFSNRVQASGLASLSKPVKMTLFWFFGTGISYWLPLVLFGKSMTSWVYGGKYTQYAAALPVLALMPVSTGVVAGVGGALRAMERPDDVFWCYLASAVVAITVGLLLTWAFGVVGAAAAMVLASLTTAAGTVWFYVQLRGIDSARCG